MLIGEISKKTGLTRDTIRFYEKQGLITVGRKERRANNYKEYPEGILSRLQTIKRIKNFGFTLNETADLLLLIERNKASCSNVTEKVQEKVTALDEKIREMIQMRESLLGIVTNCSSCGDEDANCPVLVEGVKG
jgi:DNA-binding transcriptional MerR regulator